MFSSRNSTRKITIGLISAAVLGALTLSAQAAEPLEFNYKDVALSALKMATDQNILKLSDVAPLGMISFFMPAIYQQSSGNEFAMHAAEPKAIAKAEEVVKGWPEQGPYSINTGTQFKDYDFGNKAFPLEGTSKDSYFSVSMPYAIAKGGPNSIVFPAVSYRVFFDNPDLMQTLNMPEDKASTFVQKRTSGSYVDRRLYENITFNITGFKKNVLGSVADDYGHVLLIAHITQVKLYADDHHNVLLQTYTAKQ